MTRALIIRIGQKWANVLNGKSPHVNQKLNFSKLQIANICKCSPLNGNTHPNKCTSVVFFISDKVRFERTLHTICTVHAFERLILSCINNKTLQGIIMSLTNLICITDYVEECLLPWRGTRRDTTTKLSVACHTSRNSIAERTQ